MTESGYKPAFTSRLLAGVSMGILWYSVVSIVVVAVFLLTQRVGTPPWLEAAAGIAISLTLVAFAVGYYWSRRISSPTEETKVRVWIITFVLSFVGVFLITSIIATVTLSPDFFQLTAAYGGAHLAAVMVSVATAQWRSRG
jgi:hypothetical protein